MQVYIKYLRKRFYYLITFVYSDAQKKLQIFILC